MGRRAVLEHEYQLVLGSVEAAHAGIGLGPDAEVLALAVKGIWSDVSGIRMQSSG